MENLGKFVLELRRDLKNIQNSISAFADPQNGLGPTSAHALYLQATLERGTALSYFDFRKCLSLSVTKKEKETVLKISD
jgi:hypothetical protein